MNRDNWDGIFAAEIIRLSDIEDYDRAINIADSFDKVFNEDGFLLIDPLQAAQDEVSYWGSEPEGVQL